MTRLLIVVFVMLCMQEAQAYLDGGTGSMLLQVIFGGAAGALAIVKLYWYKIKSFFKKEEKQ